MGQRLSLIRKPDECFLLDAKGDLIGDWPGFSNDGDTTPLTLLNLFNHNGSPALCRRGFLVVGTCGDDL